MRIELIQNRIDNAKAKIEKKENTISKKKALITKKEDKIRKLGFEPSDDQREVANVSKEAFWLMIDIESLEDDIIRGNKEIKEIKESLAGYEQQLQQEQEKANSRNVAAILEFLDGWKTRMFNFYNEGLTAAFAEKAAVQELSKKADSFSWGTEEYEAAKAEHKAKYKAYRNKLHGYYRDLTPEERKLPQYRYRSTAKVREGEWEYIQPYFLGNYEESIAKLQKDLEQEANRKYDFIIERTNRIVGQITDASGLRVGNKGDLNGIIKGTKGTAKVQTIGAGGYAVQCFHFRTLINKAN